MRHYIKILIVLIFCGCKPGSQQESWTVRFQLQQIWLSNLDTLDIKDSGSLTVSKTVHNETERFKIKTPDDFVTMSFEVVGGELIFEDSQCLTMDTVSFDISGQQIDLVISRFDLEEISDEESYIFWNLKYGILGQYNWTMGPLLLFEPVDLPGVSDSIRSYVIERERKGIRN